MLITSTETQNERKILPQGLYQARCCWLIDIGTQPGQGQYAPRRQCIMAFELPTEMIEVTLEKGRKETKPIVMSRFFTVSLAESSNLRKFLDDWHPSFVAVHPESHEITCDLETVIGKPALIQVAAKRRADGREFNQLGAASAPPSDIQIPDLTAERILWDFDDPKADQLEKIPDWIRKRIEACPEFAAAQVDLREAAVQVGATDEFPLQ